MRVYHAKSDDEKTHDDEKLHQLIGETDFDLEDIVNSSHMKTFKIDLTLWLLNMISYAPWQGANFLRIRFK